VLATIDDVADHLTFGLSAMGNDYSTWIATGKGKPLTRTGARIPFACCAGS